MGSQLLADVVEVSLYVHRNRRFIRDGEPRTATIVQELCVRVEVAVLGCPS